MGKQRIMRILPEIFCVFIGFWLWASPFVLQFSVTSGAGYSSIILGTVVIALAILGILTGGDWQPWAVIAMAGILMLTPWLCKYYQHVAATLNALVCGGLLVIAAAARIMSHHESLRITS